MKKALIISSWAPPMIGGPQNLYNLFSQFPKQSYSIVTSFINIDKATHSGVQGSWLPCKYFFYDKNISLDKATIKTTKNKVSSSLSNNDTNSYLSKIFKPLLISLAIIKNVFLYIKTIKKATQETKADLLIGFSDQGLALISVWLTHKIYKTPYYLFFFDIYKKNVLPQPYKFIARLFEHSIISNATLSIMTNAGTEEYYHKLYGTKIKTAVIHNSVFPESYQKIRTNYSPTLPYSIIFTGNVSWPQEQSVLNLIGAMDYLANLPVELKLYIPNPTEKLKSAVLNKNNIQLSSANQEYIPKIQAEATLLFLPLSWNTKSPDIIATATPGKFTDYLASGRPMLIHAPDYAYVSQYSREHNLGLVVDKNNVELLAKAISDYLAKPEVGNEYVKNSLEIFYKNHDAIKNAEKLTNSLNML